MSSPDTPGRMRRRIRALLKWLSACDAELRDLTAAVDEARDAEREEEATRRKALTGSAVLDRVLERPRLLGWLRRVLDVGLTRSYDRSLFCLTGDGSLIPQEDGMGWPGAPEATLPEASPTTLSAGRRRARLAYLTKRRAAVLAELDPLQERYAPHRDSRNRQRQILVGAVLLTMSFGHSGVARWLRRLLDGRYTAPRDRTLFALEGVGALVPMEEQAALRPTRRQAAKTRVSDRPLGADGKTRRQPAASTSVNDGRGKGTSAQSSTAHAPKPESRGDDAGNPDLPEPIPGWKPYRLEVHESSKGGRNQSVWGARLTGRAAVSALPKELPGRQILVTDSNMVSWTTTVTAVVSRDAGSAIVRNSGRPETDGTVSRRSQRSDSSSS